MSDMTLVLSEIQNLRADSAQLSTQVTTTNVMLENHSKEFQNHCTRFEPVYDEHIRVKNLRKARKDSIRHWSLILTIATGIIALATGVAKMLFGGLI